MSLLLVFGEGMDVDLIFRLAVLLALLLFSINLIAAFGQSYRSCQEQTSALLLKLKI